MGDDPEQLRQRLLSRLNGVWPDTSSGDGGAAPTVIIYGTVNITVSGNGNTIFGVSSGAAPNETPKRPR